MNSAGNVRWRTRLPRPAIALEIDPLGRYVIYGFSTGEIVRLDLFGAGPGSGKGTAGTAAGAGDMPRTATGSVRRPDWVLPSVVSAQQSETAVLAVTDDPACVALFISPHRLQLFTPAGEKLGNGPDMEGVGRILRTAPGWLAAATDRQIVLCDLRRNSQRRLDLSLVELTHLVIRPDSFGLALVQERDRIGRVTASGRWIWKRELKKPGRRTGSRTGGDRGRHHRQRSASHFRPDRRTERRSDVRPRATRPCSSRRPMPRRQGWSG